MSEKSSPWDCPFCGSSVSPNALGCRQCGAGKEDGRWMTPESHDGLDLPDDEFDYEDFIRREFGEGEIRKTRMQWFWWVVAVLVLITFLALTLGGAW